MKMTSRELRQYYERSYSEEHFPALDDRSRIAPRYRGVGYTACPIGLFLPKNVGLDLHRDIRTVHQLWTGTLPSGAPGLWKPLSPYRQKIFRRSLPQIEGLPNRLRKSFWVDVQEAYDCLASFSRTDRGEFFRSFMTELDGVFKKYGLPPSEEELR